MKDQATLLRALRARQPSPLPPPVGTPPTVVVGSGRGGVGKSVVSVMLAATLADQGRRVLLFDGDQNLASLHVLLGVRPAGRLEDLLTGNAAPRDLLTPVTARLWLLPGDTGAESLYALGPTDRARLHHRLSSLYDGFDAVIVDGGAGLEGVVRAAVMRATRLIVVTLPEPAALTGAYALIKIVHVQIPDLPIGVLVNRVHDAHEGRATFEKLRAASERFLKRPLRYCGSTPEDSTVTAAVRAAESLLHSGHEGPAADALRKLALEEFGTGPLVTSNAVSPSALG